MVWYAIRTKPGAQAPRREYKVETTGSVKGYRIVPSFNSNLSAVERALDEAGIIHYMPAEKRLVRDRRHTDLYKPRRFALMVGYMFVLGPLDWYKLSEVPGVHSVVGVNGRPLEIPLEDILTLRSMEALSEETFDRQSRIARKTIRAKAKNDPRLRKIASKLELADDMTLPYEMVIKAA